MAQITIYIPDDLRRRMRRFRDVNFSQAAQSGIRAALTRAEKKESEGDRDGERSENNKSG